MKVSVEEYMQILLAESGCDGIKNRGHRITCQCPYHWNKSNFNTFSISTVENVTKGSNYPFSCFSCGAHGSIYSLIAHLKKCSYKKAIRLFNKRVHLNEVTLELLKKELKKLDKIEEVAQPEIVLPSSSKNQDPMYTYLKERSRKCHHVLDIEYLVKKYELYYCGTGTYSGRIIMPMRDVDSRCVNFNNRSVFGKLKTLYVEGSNVADNIHGLNQSINRKTLIITEGSFDMFQVDCAIKNYDDFKDYGVSCTMGTHFLETRAAIVAENFEKVIILTDADEAGVKLAKNIWGQLYEEIEVKCGVFKYPWGKDPGKCTKSEIVKALLTADDFDTKRKTYLNYLISKYKFRV